VFDEQVLDEYPCAADLARGHPASVSKASQRLGMNLEKPCCALEIQRGSEGL
jgi:hypothetical protein